MVINNRFYLHLAVAEAWKYQLLTFPNPAVGCCITSACGKILAVEGHQRAGGPHAEVLALQKAYAHLSGSKEILKLTDSAQIHRYLLENHNHIFHNTTLHVTLEPCAHTGKTPSCANLIKELGIGEVEIGCRDTTKEAQGGGDMLANAGVDVVFLDDEKSKSLLEPFIRLREKNFVFFKYAARLDGTIDGGIISSKDSRILVHQMRNVCDLLVVGGETVRQDRPVLDARLVGGKAPDVLILSRTKEFDRSIPLFGVEGREVFIEDSLEKIEQYKTVMIEGGANMLSLSKDYVDYYLSFTAPKTGGEVNIFQEKMEFKILHTREVGGDILNWMKRV